MLPKVLISDQLDPVAQEVFEKKGVEVDFRPGLSADELLDIIGACDGLAVRSSTQVTPDLLSAAKNLKVIGRAGIGVDNIDVPAATNAGIVVMNTPFGNSITTAEHAISMMCALVRQIPQANESTHAGKWEKKKFMGTELYGKTLGVIGCGNIGSIVAGLALGLKMQVIAFDPFLTPERAVDIGVEKVELDVLFARADIITLHVPKNDKTVGMINAGTIDQMKDGVRLINCARGGLIVEEDLKAALDSGKVAGAALDVFEQEPAKENILFHHPAVVCTPHLGASTQEAQVNVARQVAEQMSDYLNTGAVVNALNMPAISAEDAPRLKPYMKLAEQLGRFAGQLIEHAITSIEVEYQGTVAELNIKPLTAMLIANLLGAQTDQINMVNALSVAKARGIEVAETRRGSSKDWRSVINIAVHTNDSTLPYSLTGTLFTGKEPRIVNIEGVPIEAALAPHMLFIRNDDTPGLVGRVGSLLGEAGQNIADFRLGRKSAQDGAGEAVCLVALDQAIPQDVFDGIKALPQVQHAKRLIFS